MGSGFEHGVIAELIREDKRQFARRWVDVTEPHQTAVERSERAQELTEAVHSNDRIERLTGNPMLLTALALVKRKVRKLPSRRNKLYAETISVLLNWNPRVHRPIEEDEVIPQLGYIAYEMCRRGVQQLTGGEALDLVDQIRKDYPHVRAIRRREPQALVALYETHGLQGPKTSQPTAQPTSGATMPPLRQQATDAWSRFPFIRGSDPNSQLLPRPRPDALHTGRRLAMPARRLRLARPRLLPGDALHLGPVLTAWWSRSRARRGPPVDPLVEGTPCCRPFL